MQRHGLLELFLNGHSLGKGEREYQFLFTFEKVTFKPGKLEAVSYDKAGKELSRYTLTTAGEPAKIKLTAMQNPEGFQANGADMAFQHFIEKPDWEHVVTDLVNT